MEIQNIRHMVPHGSRGDVESSDYIEQISITTQMEANGHVLHLRYLLFVISLSCMDITTLNQRR